MKVEAREGRRTQTHLVRRDAVREALADALARDVARDKVGKARLEVRKQAEDRDLERVRRVGVQLVVGLEHDEALLLVRVARRDEGRRRGGEGRREAGRVEERRARLREGRRQRDVRR